jgi:hypothetical protein
MQYLAIIILGFLGGILGSLLTWFFSPFVSRISDKVRLKGEAEYLYLNNIEEELDNFKGCYQFYLKKSHLEKIAAMLKNFLNVEDGKKLQGIQKDLADLCDKYDTERPEFQGAYDDKKIFRVYFDFLNAVFFRQKNTWKNRLVKFLFY